MMLEQTPKVILACATKHPLETFKRATLLGRSINHLPDIMRPRLMLLAENIGDGSIGLSEFYNQAIDHVERDAILVFIHDDVYIHDWNLSFTLSQALRSWDIVGAVGAASVPFGQAGWWHALIDGIPCMNNQVTLSGSINHFDPAFINPDYFGPAPMACDLLDGVFLAAKVNTLREKSLRFDPQFRFHCYDSDFCYTARALGVSLGTWPLLITHASVGNYNTAEWISAAQQLQMKLQSKPTPDLRAQHLDSPSADQQGSRFKTPEFRSENLE